MRLDENGNPIPEGEPIPSVISEEIMQDMKNIWSVFDTENKDQVSMAELKTIMRALDVEVGADHLLEEVTKMIDPENTGYITFARLTVVMEDKLKE
mmetsp:Transcript_17665/g.29849  ORF Transcript_17665/g.29849 Transcript_17665/m.29849 type:complete len:96 (-) Transcript_17665:335-622(-)